MYLSLALRDEKTARQIVVTTFTACSTKSFLSIQLTFLVEKGFYIHQGILGLKFFIQFMASNDGQIVSTFNKGLPEWLK